MRREVDEAMRVTTETLSQVTNLLAIVTAPPLDTATIRHVEVLLLQPQVLMVVVITSTGGVTKRIFTFDGARRPRAGRVGRRVPQRAPGRHRAWARACCTRAWPTRRWAPASRRSSTGSLPAFTELAATAEDTLYVDGAARLLAEHRFQDLSQINELMQVLERRVALLGVLRAALSQRDVLVRIGARERAARAARRSRSSPPATGCRRASSAPCR